MLSEVYTTEAQAEAEHALILCMGAESLIARAGEYGRLEPTTYQEHYLFSVLDTNGFKYNYINGTEGLAFDAFQLIYKSLYHLGVTVQQYGMIATRFIFSEVKTALLNRTRANTNARSLAKDSIFSPEQIVAVIKDPAKEKAKIKKIEDAASRGLKGTRGFKVEATALYPVIAMAEKSKGNAELVQKAISSAGSIDKLIRNHQKVGDDITIDKGPYTNLYDVLSKKKGQTIDSIVAKLKGTEKDIKEAESILSKDTILLTIPSLAAKELKAAKGFASDVSLFSDHFLKDFFRRLTQDIANFNRIVKDKNSDKKKVTAAARLVKTYVGISEEIIDYQLKVNKAEIYADSICAEALYKIIIASAKAEVKA